MAAPADQNEKALYDAFKKFDVNGDGHIQLKEFEKLMHSLGGFSGAEISRLFQEADTDRSGGVDWREFVKWICSGTATKNMTSDDAHTFVRYVKNDVADEAAFAQQAAISKQVEAYVKERAGGDDAADLKRKQARVLKQAEGRQDARGSAPTDLGIGGDYDGYHLPLPPTREGAIGLMQHYLLYGESKPIHPKYVAYLTTEFTNLYKQKHPKPVVHTDTPKPGRLIIVGDTHGQLADVLHIFHQLGTPAASNKYLINGDVADRGHQAVEIFMILFAFFLADPECLVINRGNHENEDMNALDADNGGGFSEEVLSKYGLMQYRRFVSAFKALSICMVIEKEIFVVHGGLARVKALTLDYINSIEHHDCTAPHPMARNVKDQVFSDLVWSDPTDQPGKFKSERGIGILFGPDMTTKFCMQNKLRFIVRGHQLPEDGRGFMKQHEGRCVTIFSASNYCGSGGNYGAVMVLPSEHFPKYEIYEHYAHPLEDLPRIMGLSDVQSAGKDRQKAEREAVATARRDKELEKMLIGVIERKPALYAHIMDLSLGNRMAPEDWAEMCAELVESNMPWSEAASHWALMESDGSIDIAKFLGRWTVTLDSESYSSFLLRAMKSVYEAILALDMDIDKITSLFDPDGNGSVELRELRQVLGMVDLGLTPSQLDRLTGQIFHQCASTTEASTMAELSADGVVRVRVQDFLNSFTVVYKQADSCTGASKIEQWVLDAINQIGQLIVKTPADKLLSDLDQACLKIQKVFRGQQARKEASGKDVSGKLPPSPAPHRSSLLKTKGGPPSLALIQEEDNKKTDGVNKMVSLFRALDSSGDGILQVEEFVQGIEKIPGIDNLIVSGQALTHDRLVSMAKAMDASGNGEINYLEFLQAFTAENSGGSDIVDSLGEDITTVLFRHRHAIRMGCHYLDEEGSGVIRAADFQTVLQGVNNALSSNERPLTATQISLLTEAMSSEPGPDEDPCVNYDAFLRAFVIRDATQNVIVKKF